MNWYPQDKKELISEIKKYLGKRQVKNINGIIVPHAGYKFSGEVAAKAFSKLPKKKKAIIFGPSHYIDFNGIALISEIITPLGKLKTGKTNFSKINVKEHSVINQIPFLQYLGFKEIIPLVVGKINETEAQAIAEKFFKENCVFIFSTDLSHFENYSRAKLIDKKTIKIIENLDFENWEKIDACGIYPLLILMKLCKMKGWKPRLIEYKNSGEITGEKDSVVGYASFVF